MLKKKNIARGFRFISLVDTADEAIKIIDQFYKKYVLKPNF